jgi:hypothetical protein
MEAEKDEEEVLELGITRASLRASNLQRSNRYFLAEEGEAEGESSCDSKGTNSSQESDFDSSDDNNEEDRDHTM